MRNSRKDSTPLQIKEHKIKEHKVCVCLCMFLGRGYAYDSAILA